LYDQCDFKGNSVELCNSLSNFPAEGFSSQIYSIYVPTGYTAKIFEDNEYKGCMEEFTESVECFKDPLHFNLLGFNLKKVTKKSNLRGQLKKKADKKLKAKRF